MAGRGFAPKDPPPDVEVTADGKLRGPRLPKLEHGDWPAPTKAWWDNWRRSAQSQTFQPTDWDFLLDTAMLHAKFHEGDASVAGELRLRVAKFGATVEDRARLKMAIGEPKKSKPAAKSRARLRIVDDQAS